MYGLVSFHVNSHICIRNIKLYGGGLKLALLRGRQKVKNERMKKLYTFFISVFVGGMTPLFGQMTAKDCFKAMPDSLAPLLTEVNKADCIDFLESKMKAEVTNRLGQKSEMTELAPDYIRMQMTSRSFWQMKMLDVNDSTQVVCTVFTVNGPVPDSDISFYTTDWKKLPVNSFIQLPLQDDFLSVPDSVDDNGVRQAMSQADLSLVMAGLSSWNDTLTFTFTTPRYMDKEANETLKPFIRPVLKYVWRDGRFVPVTSL